MKLKTLLLVFTIAASSIFAAEAKRSGFVKVKSVFNKPQNVNVAIYNEDTDNNSASLTLGGRRKFTTASILITLNGLLDQIEKGVEFTEATTGTEDISQTVRINMLAAKFKDTDGFEYTSFKDDESTVRDVSVKVLKVSKKTGEILLRVKATFDNVRYAVLDENSDEISVERKDDVKVFGVIKYNPVDTI